MFLKRDAQSMMAILTKKHARMFSIGKLKPTNDCNDFNKAAMITRMQAVYLERAIVPSRTT